MTYAELEKRIMKTGASWLRDALSSAVSVDAKELLGVSDGEIGALKKAQEHFAASVDAWLSGEVGLQPRQILESHPRYVITWAIADLLIEAEDMSEDGDDEDEDESDEDCEAHSAIAQICQANAQISSKMADLAGVVVSMTEQMRADNPYRAKDNAAVHRFLDDDVAKSTLRNIVWIFQTVHSGHHEKEYTWRECSKGVCGSAEQILAELGFDTYMNPIPRRP